MARLGKDQVQCLRLAATTGQAIHLDVEVTDYVRAARSMIAPQILLLPSTLHDLTRLHFSRFIQYKPIDLLTKHTMVVRGVQSRRFLVAGLRTLSIGGHKAEHFPLADLWVMLRLPKLENCFTMMCGSPVQGMVPHEIFKWSSAPKCSLRKLFIHRRNPRLLNCLC